MADNIAIFRINYKSDFIITLESDAGWSTPFCIKFWTGDPLRSYFVGWDGKDFINCKVDETDANKLIVLFDDHNLPIGQLKMQMAWHTTIADFPYARFDEVMNQMDVVTTIEGEEKHVELAFEGETAPEIAFSLPAYANEAQRIANEQQRIANEEARIANEEQRINKEQQRITNENQRISNEEARVAEFARLKRESEQATQDANEAAVLATTAADLATTKAQLAQDAATLANQKAQLAADKAALADSAATLATQKAQLAQEKATYAQTQGDYAKAQGNYAKAEGDAVKALNTQMTANEQTRQQNEQARQQAEQQRVTEFEQQMASQQSAYEQAEANRETAFETAEARRDAEVDEKVADITQLRTDLDSFEQEVSDDYARKDGFYETMGVGTAVNLAGQTERTDDAMYRKSGGSEEVATGLATIANIKGKTVAWNQLVENGNFSQGSTYWTVGNGTMSVSDGKLNFTLTATPYSHGIFQTKCKAIKDHKIYIALDALATSQMDVNPAFFLKNDAGFTRTIQANTNTHISGIATITQNGANGYLRIYVTASDGETLTISNVQVFDLTLIYGEGNEPTSVAQFEADYFKWFGKPLTYEDYDEGSLRSVQLDALKTTGFNQYDNGTAKVIGGLQYQITGTYTSITLNNEAITPDANGLFTPSTTGTLTIVGGGSDTCVHISGERNGEYEPYEEHVAPIPVTTLKGKLNGEGASVVVFPDGMRSAGDVHDEIYTVGDKTYAIVRTGSVDLGTLTWLYDTNYGTRFYVPNFNSRNFEVNGICSQYPKRNDFWGSSHPDKSFVLYTYWKQLNIRDTSFTDAATFKTAMSGVMLYFELETPLVYEVDDFALPKRYLVDGGGTEEQVQKANVQGLAAILTCIYGVDAVGILNKLPKNYISEASMDNLLAQLNTATGGTWSKSWNENSGEWDFSYTPNAQTNNVTNQEEA